MTERIYYNDSYLVSFEAVVKEIRETDAGTGVVLDKTAFYPTSGGQLFDRGTIGGCPVIDVLDDKLEIVHHLEQSPAFAVGDTLACEIDWERRRENMQKHTGQHILSQAFVRACEAETVSARLGDDDSTVDLNIESLTDEEIHKAELLANEIIFENRPITVEFVSVDKLKDIPLRKIPVKDKEIFRIITVDDFDWSACGGTHCNLTGSVGIIKLTARESIRGNIRLHFLTGFGALSDYNRRYGQIEQISNIFSRHSSESVQAVEALIEQSTSVKRDFTAFRKEMLPALIQSWMKEAGEYNGKPLVCLDFTGKDFSEAKDAALGIIHTHEAIAIIVADDKVVAAVNDKVDLSAADIIKKASVQFGGKGGGSPKIAQGGGFRPGDLKVLLAEPGKVLDI